MGGISLSQEIIEHILQYADGETLLTCLDVSPEFAAAVKYLDKTKNIWKRCYFEEKKDKYPYGIISKFHPHNEGFKFQKNWALIYESSFLGNSIFGEISQRLTQFEFLKDYVNILDVETHGDLILVLVRYNKDFSIYYRIVTVDLQDRVVDKSCRFFADMVYVTPLENLSIPESDVIALSCDSCQLVAVPVTENVSAKELPKFSKNLHLLTVEHPNGDRLWINSFGKLISKGKCFHTGTAAEQEDIRLKDSKSIKVFHKFSTLFISCGKTKREFNTFGELGANVTASLVYSKVLLLGTNTGILYAYNLESEAGLRQLQLSRSFWQFIVSFDEAILVIDVMELKSQFVIVCCSEKSVYQVHIDRKLRSA